MSNFLRDIPIKRKLMFVVIFATTFALGLMCLALLGFELLTFRKELTTNTTVLAQIVGSNSAGALAFDDREGAQENLASLRAEKQITAAAIYTARGELFAAFSPDAPQAEIPRTPGPDGYVFHARKLVMFQPVMQSGKRKGTIYLQADLGGMYTRIGIYGVLVLVVGACAIAAAVASSTKLQRRISMPIQELADAARAVSERQDYTVRAPRHGADEIGELTDAFNQMLRRIGETTAALSASEERLRLALEGSQMGTWEWDLETDTVTWDDYMFPLYGVSKEGFDGFETFKRVIVPEDFASVQKALEQTLEQHQNLSIDFRIRMPDGQVRHMASRGRAFYDASGKAQRMNGVSMDVTQSKRTEEALKQAKEAAEAANKAKDEFLAILSHELRTPLTPVLATVALLDEETSSNPELRRDLETIRRNVEVEARLIDDLLDVTRIARGKLELHRKTQDLRSLLEHAISTYLKDQAEAKRLRVKVDLRADATHLLADSSRMTQVFWNLFQNACKFTPEGGSIEVSVFNEAPTVADGAGTNGYRQDLVITVSDTGIGIEEEMLPRIFDAFEQGERSRTRLFGGLGLGLAISHAIVDMHGGTLTARSRGRDHGACFTIRLPDAERREESAEDPGRASRRRVLPDTSGRRLRILLVEDHIDTARQLQRLLERMGHQVTQAGGVQAALECAHQQRDFDLLISDLGLPDGSGHDLMRELLKQSTIPGIALSGFGMESDIRESLAAGFRRHLTKPVDWTELKATVQTMADESVAV